MNIRRPAHGIISLGFICACSLLWVGCAKLHVKPSSAQKDQLLRGRVEGFMEAKAQDRWGDLAEFYAPADREQAPKGAGPRRVRVIEPQVVEIERTSADLAVVTVGFNVEMGGFTFPGARERQTWIWEKGTWFYKPQGETPFGAPPPAGPQVR